MFCVCAVFNLWLYYLKCNTEYECDITLFGSSFFILVVLICSYLYLIFSVLHFPLWNDNIECWVNFWYLWARTGGWGACQVMPHWWSRFPTKYPWISWRSLTDQPNISRQAGDLFGQNNQISWKACFPLLFSSTTPFCLLLTDPV